MSILYFVATVSNFLKPTTTSFLVRPPVERGSLIRRYVCTCVCVFAIRYVFVCVCVDV